MSQKHRPAWTGHDTRTWGAPHPLTRAAAFAEVERAFIAAAALYCSISLASVRYQRSTIQAKRTAMLAAFRAHDYVRAAVLREGPP